MKPETLVEEFRAFIGDDKQFRRFVKHCAEHGSQRRRLRYWQEQIWHEFTEHAPHHNCQNTDSILTQFFLCHVHLSPLQTTTYHIAKKWIITTVGGGDGLTPYAYRHPFAESESENTRPIDVLHCDECLRISDNQSPIAG